MERCPYCNTALKGPVEKCPACGMPLTVSPHLPQGTLLFKGRYSVGKVLGQGGFGITYLGADTTFKRPVAIKELFPEGSSRQNSAVVPPSSISLGNFGQARQAFEEEARVLARFSHPGIVRVFDVFEENSTAYLVMEFLKGQTLGKRVEKTGRLSAAEVTELAIRIATALEEVHKEGLLHRDIKPDNLFLTEDDRVVLIDFGSARQFVRNKTVRHTRLVTPGYAPPEQYATQAKFGPYTDIYSLGATLLHALTGQQPPPSTDRMMGTALPNFPANTPEKLKKALQKSLEINIADRPQTVQEFLALLTGSNPNPKRQPSPAPNPPAPRPNPQPAPQPAPQPVPQPAPQPAPQPVPQPAPQPSPQPARRPAARRPSWVRLLLAQLAGTAGLAALVLLERIPTDWLWAWLYPLVPLLEGSLEVADAWLIAQGVAALVAFNLAGYLWALQWWVFGILAYLSWFGIYQRAFVWEELGLVLLLSALGLVLSRWAWLMGLLGGAAAYLQWQEPYASLAVALVLWALAVLLRARRS